MNIQQIIPEFVVGPWFWTADQESGEWAKPPPQRERGQDVELLVVYMVAVRAEPVENGGLST